MKNPFAEIAGAALVAAGLAMAGPAATEPRAITPRIEIHDPRKAGLSRRARKRLEAIDERANRSRRGPSALYSGAGLSRSLSRAKAGLRGYRPHGWHP